MSAGYDKNAVLEAWKMAVNSGVIDKEKLRPEIARAWERCISFKIDPWSTDFPKLDEELLSQMRAKYSTILEAASPVLQYLVAIFNCNVSVSDIHGFVFDLITPLSSYPRTLGTYVAERFHGNGNITIAIQEHKPCRVDGYEHFRAISQSYSGVAAPFNAPDGREYILCMNDPFAPLPDYALDSCIAAAQLIGKLAFSRRKTFSHLSSASFFDPIIQGNTAVIVTDKAGMLLTANALAKPALKDFEKYSYATKSLGDYLKKPTLLAELLGDAESGGHVAEFKPAGRGKRAIVMKLLRLKKIQLVNGESNLVFVFEHPVEAAGPDSAKPSTLMRDGSHSSDYIGCSPEWKKVDDLVRNVAARNSNVMILGATGTGKEVVARALHRYSGRVGEFVAINCGALPRDLLASELFGYEGGAFTGARSSGAKGKFEYADGGTLFLDEIGDMPMDMQVSLLRVLQERCVMRIGSNKPVPVNVRVVAATNQNLQKRIAEGKFRSDLWYRLSVIEINLPSLKDRAGDVRLLAEYFNESISESLDMGCLKLSNNTLCFLESYSWPGNVRELKNAMEKALIMANGRPLEPEDFPSYMQSYAEAPIAEAAQRTRPARDEQPVPAEPEEMSPRLKRELIEREKLVKVLTEECGNITRSAKRLGMSRNTLYRKIEKMNIKLTMSEN